MDIWIQVIEFLILIGLVIFLIGKTLRAYVAALLRKNQLDEQITAFEQSFHKEIQASRIIEDQNSNRLDQLVQEHNRQSRLLDAKLDQMDSLLNESQAVTEQILRENLAFYQKVCVLLDYLDTGDEMAANALKEELRRDIAYKVSWNQQQEKDLKPFLDKAAYSNGPRTSSPEEEREVEQ